MSGEPWMTSEQAARRLGVKPATLYAYVSRGLIRSEKIPGQRRSRFLRSDVEKQAQRTRRGGRAGGLEVVIETECTLLDPAGRLFYRGWDVADAVETATFETVATWLWTGEREPVAIEAPPEIVARARSAADAVEDADPADPVDRLRGALGGMRSADAFRTDRRPVAVARTGRTVVAGLVAALPCLGTEPGPGASVAARLWPRLTPAPPSRGRIRILDAALVLLADHELAASTLAARVAASTWADPYLVLLAGLSVLGGPLHGGASEGARDLLRDIAATSPEAAISRRLGAGERIPGFGHRVYETRDPRATLVFDLLAEHGGRGGDDRAARTIALMADRDLPFPNIDFALAVLAERYEFIDGATEALFAMSRSVGWLAHAIEEYEHALRYRVRAAYVGPPPVDADR